MKTFVVLICAAILTACASYKDLGGGRYEKITDIQSPSAFGVSVAYSKVESCEGRKSPYYPWKMDFTDCHEVTAWEKSSGGAWAPSLIEGAMMGMGFGIGAAVSKSKTTINNQGSSATSGSTSAATSSSTSATTTGTAHFPPGHFK